MNLEARLERISNDGITGLTVDKVLSYGNINWDNETMMQKLQTAVHSDWVKKHYHNMVDGYLGRFVKNRLSRSAKYAINKKPDAYLLMDLPDNVLASVIKLELKDPKTNLHKQYNILAYNRAHKTRIALHPIDRFYVPLHEFVHLAGEHSEAGTEGLLKDAFNSAKNYLGGGLKKLANNLAQYAQQRQLAQATK
ncbi:MAG: hypothetical protein ABIC04_06525 [Nanoarchaeota archaeon]